MIKRILLTAILFITAVIKLSSLTIEGRVVPIPESRKELERRYLAIVKIYYQESNAHKRTLSKLTNQIQETKRANEDLKKAIDLIKELQKSRIDIFSSYLIFYGGYSFDSQSIAGGIGWQGILFEKILFGIEAKYPMYTGLMLGVKL